ncbi:MAG: thiosulfohydrolase SoxB, partial [Burkholderiaceae bacterium]|nr:thiosulfohydrolase SoxB [Burkholderiaceae bacterium]
LSYAIDPNASIGKRIGDLSVGGRLLEADKSYTVASWAPVAEGAKGEPIWDVVATYLKDQRSIPPPRLNLPLIKGEQANPGFGKSWRT